MSAPSDLTDAIEALGERSFLLAAPIIERVERCGSDTDSGRMNRLGLARQLRSDVEEMIYTSKPDWPTLRLVHRVWAAAQRWADDAVREARK